MKIRRKDSTLICDKRVCLFVNKRNGPMMLIMYWKSKKNQKRDVFTVSSQV